MTLRVTAEVTLTFSWGPKRDQLSHISEVISTCAILCPCQNPVSLQLESLLMMNRIFISLYSGLRGRFPRVAQLVECSRGHAFLTNSRSTALFPKLPGRAPQSRKLQSLPSANVTFYITIHLFTQQIFFDGRVPLSRKVRSLARFPAAPAPPWAAPQPAPGRGRRGGDSGACRSAAAIPCIRHVDK